MAGSRVRSPPSRAPGGNNGGGGGGGRCRSLPSAHSQKGPVPAVTPSTPHVGPHPAGHLPQLDPQPWRQPRGVGTAEPARPRDLPEVSQPSGEGEHPQPGLHPGVRGCGSSGDRHWRHLAEAPPASRSPGRPWVPVGPGSPHPSRGRGNCGPKARDTESDPGPTKISISLPFPRPACRFLPDSGASRLRAPAAAVPPAGTPSPRFPQLQTEPDSGPRPDSVSSTTARCSCHSHGIIITEA